MNRITVLALVATLSSASPLAAQSRRDDLTPLAIEYTTTVSDDRQSFLIDIDIDRLQRPILHVAMPNWTPGAYYIGRYGENVESFSATTGDGILLDTVRMDHQTWSIATEGVRDVRITYRVSAARGRRGEVPLPRNSVTGLQIRGPNTYMYVPGSKDVPVRSTYVLPDGWKLANGLLTTDDPLVRWAKDYDTFIDAPGIIGQYEERTFDVNGTPFSCVFFENAQEYDFDIDAFVDIVHAIVANIGALFGEFPFPNYVFLYTLPGGGGLEHLNSTSIGLRSDAQKANPEAGASVTSHEFFHAWNVKRIRPETLGPFEYEHENYTGNLWVSEGWTSYFGDLTLARTGILSPDEYLTHLTNVIAREQNKVRRKEHSVYWASRNVWHRDNDATEPRVDYYGKGELLGMLIDLKIRHATGGKKSLNDVMRFFNRWFAQRGDGFAENDVERACTAISNHEFGEFFARYVHGTMDPPIGEILSYAGIEYDEAVVTCSFPFTRFGDRIIGRRDADLPEDEPRPGDRIASAEGDVYADLNDFLRDRAPGDVVYLELDRAGVEVFVEVTLEDRRSMVPSMRFDENATPEQVALREAWLGSVE